MIIKPDNDKLVYSGRIDWSNTEAPVFVFPCTSVKMKFSGKKGQNTNKEQKSLLEQLSWLYTGWKTNGIAPS